MAIPPVKTDVEIGKNVRMDICQDEITLRIPMGGDVKPVGPSKSGKNMMLADTSGPRPIEGYPGLHINVMVYKTLGGM